MQSGGERAQSVQHGRSAFVILRQMAHLLPISSDRLGSTALAQGAPVPYAIAIAAGALLVLPQAQMFAVYTG